MRLLAPDNALVGRRGAETAVLERMIRPRDRGRGRPQADAVIAANEDDVDAP